MIITVGLKRKKLHTVLFQSDFYLFQVSKFIKEVIHMDNKIQIFEDKRIRTAWNEETEDWYFSVIDVIEILTESENPRDYWKVLKHRLAKEGSEVVTNCNQLKLPATDGKMRLTDVLDTKGILRLVQSVPSPKAEPFKMWLALEINNKSIEDK